MSMYCTVVITMISPAKRGEQEGEGKLPQDLIMPNVSRSKETYKVNNKVIFSKLIFRS